MQFFKFPRLAPDPEIEALRRDVRDFIAGERAAGGFVPVADSWCSGFSAAFSRKLGERGWIGMTWPKEYGGRELSAFHRYVVTEELLAAGAPVLAHWIADRQSGPLLIRYGSEGQKRDILPRIAAGACYFAIGMSEPNAGSDLAAVRTKAVKVEGGWRLTGTKLWSTGAHHCHYMIVLARTRELDPGDSHGGLSQFLVDLSTDGVSIRAIPDMTGEDHFNETHFEDVFVPGENLLGAEGEGWSQVTGELALERSGPERFLSTFVLLEAAVSELSAAGGGDERALRDIGLLAARLRTLRGMSQGVAALLEQGQAPETSAALVKELGTRFEGELVDRLRGLLPLRPGAIEGSDYQRLLAESLLHLPSFTLRGGTNEILRGIIARGLGLR